VGPSPFSSATDGAHPNSRCARSITGWRWRGSSCGSGLQINANDRVALKAVAADQTLTTAAHDCRAGNPLWPSRYGKHDRLAGVDVSIRRERWVLAWCTLNIHCLGKWTRRPLPQLAQGNSKRCTPDQHTFKISSTSARPLKSASML